MAPRPKHRTTLKDVALQTGYSINTVSRALRNMPDISSETSGRIQQVARQMGYISNTIASSLRSGYTHTIAVIIGDVSNLYFSIITEEMEKQARRHGYSTILLNTAEDDDAEYLAIQTALNRNVDGILISPTQKTSRNTQFLKDSGVPFVLFGRRSFDVQTDYVVANDRMGGYQATKHLIENGHRDILLVNGPPYNSSAHERGQGYRDALAEAGIPVRPELICQVPVKGDGCQKQFDGILRQGVRFTGIFVFSDMVALTLMDYLQFKGYKVPEDFSIVGFDYIQSNLKLPVLLSSIDNSKSRIAYDSVDILLKRIQGEHPPQGHFQKMIDTRLIDRHSVRALD